MAKFTVCCISIAVRDNVRVVLCVERELMSMNKTSEATPPSAHLEDLNCSIDELDGFFLIALLVLDKVDASKFGNDNLVAKLSVMVKDFFDDFSIVVEDVGVDKVFKVGRWEMSVRIPTLTQGYLRGFTCAFSKKGPIKFSSSCLAHDGLERRRGREAV